jgi:hypothetical protein
MATLDERIAAAAAKKEASEKAYTDADRAEAAKREQLAKLEDDAADVDTMKRDLDIERRMDTARDALGDGVHLKEVVVDGLPHTFIVKNAGAKSYNQWENDISKAGQKGRGIDRSQVNRTYALASVHDWNGITDWKAVNEDGEPNGRALADLLTDYPGIATSIVNAAAKLNGLASEERKSKG